MYLSVHLRNLLPGDIFAFEYGASGRPGHPHMCIWNLTLRESPIRGTFAERETWHHFGALVMKTGELVDYKQSEGMRIWKLVL